MQHKCAQHKWDHFFSWRNYETNALLDLKKKLTHDETHFIKPTEEEEEEKKDFFHII